MREALSRMMSALMSAEHFEDAATAALLPMLRLAQQSLATSRYRDQGRILRGLVHLRPGEGYRRLWSIDAPAAEGAPAEQRETDVEELDPAPLLASATAWRSVVEHGFAISIDVNLGTLQPHPPGGTPPPGWKGGTTGSAFRSDESQQRLLGRQTTHVCALPLRAFGGAIEGMISLEASCLAAIGQPFIWKECVEPLQLMTDIAAAYLLHLPLRPVASRKVDEFLPVVGSTMSGLLPVLRIFAQQDETLLVTGPTGAGKSRLARWCHEQSSRQHGPFEVLDLVTVPEDLQMAELFGWKKGAFTGALKDTPGNISRAAGGTLFIDEIDKLSLRAQAGLLHVLEERRFRVLGEGGGEQRADVRFIIGTNARLQEAVRAGRFREDLYYRINVLPLQLPPLDERRDEIALWADYMANRRHRERSQTGRVYLSDEAVRLLNAGSWPGNLRQLDNIIRRAYTLALLEHGGPSTDLQLQEKHVGHALRYESVGGGGQQPLTDALLTAATAFVGEAERHRESPLDLDLADAFRGFVMGVASRKVGRDEAFRLFNRDNAIKSRNQSRMLRRELEKVDALYKAIGREQEAPFSDLLDSESEAQK